MLVSSGSEDAPGLPCLMQNSDLQRPPVAVVSAQCRVKPQLMQSWGREIPGAPWAVSSALLLRRMMRSQRQYSQAPLGMQPPPAHRVSVREWSCYPGWHSSSQGPAC